MNTCSTEGDWHKTSERLTTEKWSQLCQPTYWDNQKIYTFTIICYAWRQLWINIINKQVRNTGVHFHFHVNLVTKVMQSKSSHSVVWPSICTNTLLKFSSLFFLFCQNIFKYQTEQHFWNSWYIFVPFFFSLQLHHECLIRPSTKVSRVAVSHTSAWMFTCLSLLCAMKGNHS